MTARTVVYAVGGTGAKIAEALIYLCAAGLTSKSWGLRLIDQDKNNGNATRAGGLALDYRQLRADLQRARLDRRVGIFTAELDASAQILPVLPDSKASLAQAYGILDRPSFATSPDALLMHALFSREERDDRMVNGFKARPAVGCAAFLSDESRRDGSTLWAAVEEDLRAALGGGVDQFLFLGSLFGGTGASGIPTLARHIRQRLTRDGGTARIASVLCLRYFDVDNRREYGPVALARMRAALAFYDQALGERAGVRLLDDLYLVGLDPELTVPAEAEGGGNHQANPPLFPELIAALAAVRSMAPPPDGQASRPAVWIAGRAARPAVTWDDLPTASVAKSASGEGPLRDGRELLLDFTRFAYAYAYGFHPAERLSRLAALEDFVPLIRFLNLRKIRDGVYDDLGHELSKFCGFFLAWFGAVQNSRDASGLDIALGGLADLVRERPDRDKSGGSLELRHEPATLANLESAALRELKEGFEHLKIKGVPPNLARVVLRMGSVRRPRERSFGAFVGALYGCSSASDGAQVRPDAGGGI